MPIRSYPEYDGHRLYKNVGLQIRRYTGKILAAKGFMDEFYVHMGYQQPYAYQTVMEFSFERGVLIGVSDQSAAAEKQRKSFILSDSMWKHADDTLDEQSSTKFVRDCFALDYETKASWIDGVM